MLEDLKVVLEIQEFDIKMIRLMQVKKERQKELDKIGGLKDDIRRQVSEKEEQVLEIKKEIRQGETRGKEIQEKISKLEEQQMAVKKMDEFNALTQEMTQSGREKTALEQTLSDLMDKLATEEDLLASLKENLVSTEENSVAIEKDIAQAIAKINEEGLVYLKERDALIPKVSEEYFKVYEKLLHNKKDRVVVPIENRTCSGCHIVLTAQQENLVRKQERIVFCEHCSRILYWHEAPTTADGEEGAPTRRRRRRTPASTT